MSMIATALHYETVADSLNAGDYRVEAINNEKDGEVYVAIFSGPDAKERAEEFARWKNS
jgi:alpha-beta hydrolase superfamily lysophospholipase